MPHHRGTMNAAEQRLRHASLAAVAAVALAAAAISLVAPVTAFDHRILDAQFRSARDGTPAPADERVVVVGIDQRTVKAIAEPMTLWHAWIGRFLEGLRAARPRVVGLDIVLPDRSYESVAPGLDSTLARGLIVTRTEFPTILAKTVDDDGQPRPIYPAFVAAAGVEPGFALWTPDADGLFRRFDERLGDKGEAVPTLAGQVARAAGKEPRHGYIDYAHGAPFDYVPFIDVMASIERGDAAALKKRFEGRIVLVGVVLPLVDVVRLPVRLAAWGPTAEATPGVLLQAQAVRVLLADRMLQPASAPVIAILAALAALLAGATARPLVGTAITGLVCAAALIASGAQLRAGVFLPVATIVGAALIAWLVRQGATVAHRLLERHRLRKSFSGYVSPDVMAEILKGKLSPEADGEQQYVCLLFSDIRGYTTRSEGMKPADLLAFLNRYFDGVVNLIHRHGGTVVCFMGDGIMAVFGAPKHLDNPCLAAFEASRAMLANLGEQNARLAAEGHAPIDVGIGLHAGVAVLGHVGSRERHDYTAIGDVTNVASRLESATKEAGYRIVVSDEVAGKLPDRTGLVPLGPMKLKGHTPVAAHGYDPIGEPPAAVR